jgi:hypothetical protein
VAQYVWQASLALFPDNQSEQDRWVREHLLEVLGGKASLELVTALTPASWALIP